MSTSPYPGSSPAVADSHLDLGCGTLPRNPYGRAALFGVDIRRLESSEVDSGTMASPVPFDFRAANLSFEPIPHPDDRFASVSAFDFIEHVPRVLNGAEPNTTVFPFVRLMNEVWRVLAPGGLFYAMTPCYPGREAFSDPTHVNVITDKTHLYFCGDDPPGRMYGFDGRFDVKRAQWVIPEHARSATQRLGWKQSWDRWRRERRGGLVYFLWELQAVKPLAAGTNAGVNMNMNTDTGHGHGMDMTPNRASA